MVKYLLPLKLLMIHRYPIESPHPDPRCPFFHLQIHLSCALSHLDCPLVSFSVVCTTAITRTYLDKTITNPQDDEPPKKKRTEKKKNKLFLPTATPETSVSSPAPTPVTPILSSRFSTTPSPSPVSTPGSVSAPPNTPATPGATSAGRFPCRRGAVRVFFLSLSTCLCRLCGNALRTLLTGEDKGTLLTNSPIKLIQIAGAIGLLNIRFELERAKALAKARAIGVAAQMNQMKQIQQLQSLQQIQQLQQPAAIVGTNVNAPSTPNTPGASLGTTEEVTITRRSLKPQELTEEEKALLPLEPYCPHLTGCRSVTRYTKIKRVSQGTYGTVYKASVLQFLSNVTLSLVILFNVR